MFKLLSITYLSNISNFPAKLLIDHRALQPLAQLRRHPGLVGVRRVYHRLLRKPSGRDRAKRWSWPLERP